MKGEVVNKNVRLIKAEFTYEVDGQQATIVDTDPVVLNHFDSVIDCEFTVKESRGRKFLCPLEIDNETGEHYLIAGRTPYNGAPILKPEPIFIDIYSDTDCVATIRCNLEEVEILCEKLCTNYKTIMVRDSMQEWLYEPGQESI